MNQLSPDQLKQALATVEQDFLSYQIKYIRDSRRFLIYDKAVRTGITYAHSWKMSLKRAVRKPTVKQNHEFFASKNLKVASEYLGYHRKWAEFWNTLFGGDFIDLSLWTTEKAVYPGGNIYVVSSDPDAVRGVEGDQTRDEFAFHDQQEASYSAAQGRIQWLHDGQVTLISSQSHPETLFYQMCVKAKDGRLDGFGYHRTTLEDAVNAGLALKVPGKHLDGADARNPVSITRCNERFIRSVKRTCVSEEQYQREYMCAPASLGALISEKEYDAVVLRDPETKEPLKIDTEMPPLRAFGELYVGVDVGRTHDLTVIWVLEEGHDPTAEKRGCPQFEKVYRTVCVRAIKNMPFPAQDQIIRSICSHPSVSRVVVDMGAVGRQVAESLRDELGGIVEPYAITAPRKMELCERVKAFVQQQRVSLHPDPKVRADILSMRRDKTRNGSLTYVGGTTDGHADHFMALSLALQAAAGTTKARLAGDGPRLPADETELAGMLQ
jgi:phage FluMu gp28-like protein